MSRELPAAHCYLPLLAIFASGSASHNELPNPSCQVYNIEPRAVEPVGGAARFATAVRRAQAACDPPPLVLFSGDCLNPSLMSAFTRGQQMVPVLNMLGVHAAAVGNHDCEPGLLRGGHSMYLLMWPPA